MFGRGVELKTPAQLDRMRAAGLIVAHTLAEVRDTACAGMTTADLDAIGRARLGESGASSNFLDYGARGKVPGFPGVMCTSVNDEVVHGVPGPRRLLDGDVVSIDFGAVVDGWHSDSALTFVIGTARPAVHELLRVTEEAMWHGIAAASLGGRVGDISHAVEEYVRAHGDYGILQGYTGHGIGSAMHQPPDVPNTGKAGRGPRLVPGLVLAVEPIITLGAEHTRVLGDDWTVTTLDESVGAHFEHSFTVTEDGTWVLSAHDGGAAKLAEFGVAYGGP